MALTFAIAISVLVGLYFLVVFVLYFFQSRFIYPGAARTALSDAVLKKQAQIEIIKIGLNQIYSVYFKSTNKNAPLIVVFHGNKSLVEDWTERSLKFIESGFDVLLLEYPGYGYSKGILSKENIVNCMTEGVKIFSKKLSDKKIHIVGHSLGTGIAAEVCTKVEVTSLTLISPYTRMADIFIKRGVLPFFLKHPLDVIGNIVKVKAPKLVIHGVYDTVTPFSHGQKISKAGNTKFITLKKAHADILDPFDPVRDRIVNFMLKSTSQTAK